MRASKRGTWRSLHTRLQVERLEDRALLSTSIPLNPTTWTSLGPTHTIGCQTAGAGACSGRLTGIAAHPTDPNTYYVASAGGGVWKTTTGGENWTPLTDDQDSPFMGAIALAPSNPNIIYAGTGEANHGPSKTRLNRENIYYGLGVLRSRDAGTTWELVGQKAFYRRSISRIVVHPTDPNIVYAAVGARPVNGLTGHVGVWKSTNGGDSWRTVTLGLGLSETDAVSDLVMDPTNPQVLYAAVGTPTGSARNGVYKTINGGATWFVAGNFPTGAADPQMGRISLALAASTPNILHAAIAGSGQAGAGLGLLRHARSFDSGSTWLNLTDVPNYMSGSGDYMNVLAMHPTDPDIIYASGLTIVVSRNGGFSWSNIETGADGNGPHVDHHAFAFDAAGRLLDGNDGGAWRLENPFPGQIHWANLNTDLLTFQFVGVALDPTNPDRAFGGAQDNGTLRFADSLVWTHIRAGDGGYARVDHGNPQIIYHTYQYTVGNGFLERSDNDGGNWQRRTMGINTNDPAKFYQPYVMDPTNPARLVLGTNRVYETTNRGNSWQARSQPLTAGWTVNAIIDAVAPAPSDVDTLYASAAGRVFVTRDHGVSWTETNPLPPQPGLRLTDIKVDPNNPELAVVTTSSFNDLTGGGRVWLTTDAGANWFDITGNLPELPAWSIAVDWGAAANGDERYFLGTDGGVFVMENYSGDWPRMALGLPNVQVHELELNLDLGILSAATHGRGLWQLEVQAQDRGDDRLAWDSSADVAAAWPTTRNYRFAPWQSVEVPVSEDPSEPEQLQMAHPLARPVAADATDLTDVPVPRVSPEGWIAALSKLTTSLTERV